MLKDKEQSGFRDAEKEFKPCPSTSHNPPSHLYIPPDKDYVHVCPACGAKFVLHGSRIIF
jgi:hypothetical protein